jgi:hypothetical protein
MKAVRAKPEPETTQRLMRILAGSLVSWLTFQQSAKRSRMKREHWMYGPIFEVASARGWKTIPQFSVKIGKTTKYPDFLFYRTNKPVTNNSIALLEVSHIKSGSAPTKVSEDKKKLQKIRRQDIFKGRHGTISRYVMLVSYKDVLETYCKSNLKQAVPLFTQLTQRKAPVSKKLGWIYWSPYPFRLRWCVMVLIVPER